jgi:alpha-ketoglutarate-dependent taurine dioxygenase
MSILRGNEGWHTDSSYMPIAAKASMLSAHVVPPRGGATEWADMRAAYDALPFETKAKIDGLAAHHSLVYSQRRAGETPVEGAYGIHDGPAPLRPLVKVHPVTGRPALFIGRHAHAIPGLGEEESETLLDELLAFACRTPRVYTHHWAVGDLVVWDNRCVLHRAQPWDWSEPRVMQHTRVTGDPVTEAALG